MVSFASNSTESWAPPNLLKLIFDQREILLCDRAALPDPDDTLNEAAVVSICFDVLEDERTFFALLAGLLFMSLNLGFCFC